MRDVASLAEGLRAGDRRAVARVISLVENDAPEAREVLKDVYPLTGHARSVGITGAPGSGKSSLVERLVGRMRDDELRVGVIAVDPTSPFSGGALLGDRVRMQAHALDPGVFIRSMATRGHLGGLALAAPEAMRVLEAAGSDVVVVETVGVGQSEVEVARQADTTVVVVAPGMGDAIQAAKAGVLEVADVFCVNKADRDGANDTARDLRNMLDMGAGRDPDWEAPVVMASATEDTGIDELWEAMRGHHEHLESAGRLSERRRERLADEIREIAAARLRARVEEAAGRVLDELTEEVLGRRLDPYSAAEELLRRFA